MARSLKKDHLLTIILELKLIKQFLKKVKGLLKLGQDVQQFYLNLLGLPLTFTMENNIILFL